MYVRTYGDVAAHVHHGMPLRISVQLNTTVTMAFVELTILELNRHKAIEEVNQTAFLNSLCRCIYHLYNLCVIFYCYHRHISKRIASNPDSLSWGERRVFVDSDWIVL